MAEFKAFMDQVVAKNPEQKEFHQAVQEVVESLWPVLDKRPEYRKAKYGPSPVKALSGI